MDPARLWDPPEMVTPRLQMMAENSRFKKKVHFGGTVRPLKPLRGGVLSLFSASVAVLAVLRAPAQTGRLAV